MGSGHVLERDEQVIADEGKEHMRPDALVEAVEHRAHDHVALEFLERLFDLGQPHLAPQRFEVFVGQVGVQQVAAFAALRSAQPVAPQCESEGARRGASLTSDTRISTRCQASTYTSPSCGSGTTRRPTASPAHLSKIRHGAVPVPVLTLSDWPIQASAPLPRNLAVAKRKRLIDAMLLAMFR